MTDLTQDTPGEDDQVDRNEMVSQDDGPIEAERNEAEQNHLNSESDSAVQESSEAGGEGRQTLAPPATSPGEVTRASAGHRDRGVEQGSPLTRMTIGSALIAMDTLAERIENAESEEADETPELEPLDVLIPMAEWDERFGLSRNKDARYVMLGMMADARSGVRRGESILNRVSTRTAKAINFVFGPVTRSSLFRPVGRRFNSAVSRGEAQVKHWMDLGREEDYHSRRLAQTALNRAADDTMDELVDNPRIELFIQEIIQAQSQGMIDEGIEEVRERAISADLFLERPFRRLLRRPTRDSIPPPEFDPHLVLSQKKRHIPLQEDSLLGYYAGFLSRLFAFALDISFLVVILALSSWLITATIQILGVDSLYTSVAEDGSIGGIIAAVWAGSSGFVVVAGYFMALWILTGQTLGMMLMGLRVVATDGDRLTFWQALRRLIGMIIAAIPFFLGFAWIIVDNRRQGWQDKLGGTFIVYAWDARPDETFLSDYIFRRY